MTFTKENNVSHEAFHIIISTDSNLGLMVLVLIISLFQILYNIFQNLFQIDSNHILIN